MKDLAIYCQSAEYLALVNRFETALRSTNREGIEPLLLDLKRVHPKTGLSFFTQPASTQYHGCDFGGLLEHSLNVLDALTLLQCPEVPIPADSLIITALLHDLCKWNCYRPNIGKKGGFLSKPFAWDEPDDQILGHGSKSVIVAMEYIPLTNMEKMMILWHMGPYDRNFDLKSKAKLPHAYLLYLADNYATLKEEARHAQVTGKSETNDSEDN